MVCTLTYLWLNSFVRGAENQHLFDGRIGSVDDSMVDMVKLPKSLVLEVDSGRASWFSNLINEEREVPRYALKYVIIIAAE